MSVLAKRVLAAGVALCAVVVWLHRACSEPPYAASFRPDDAPAEGARAPAERAHGGAR